MLVTGLGLRLLVRIYRVVLVDIYILMTLQCQTCFLSVKRAVHILYWRQAA
jgi:hypothetical protein